MQFGRAVRRVVDGVFVVLLFSLVSAGARAQTFAVTLQPSSEVGGFGDPGASGVGVLTFSGTTIAYTFVVQGTQPTLGYIHKGDKYAAAPPLLSFGVASHPFDRGLATGSVVTTQANVDQILADPSGFYINLISADHPAGALRGELAPLPKSTVYLPTVAKAEGLNNTNFVTDLSLVNRGPSSGGPATVTLDFFASSAQGLTQPTASKTRTVAPGEQVVLKDLLGSQFDASGDGALRITAPPGVSATARVFNDQRSAGAGTTGLLVPASGAAEVAASGTLQLLSNASPSDTADGVGYRTNIGYFNPYPGAVNATFRAIRSSDGAVLGAVDRTIPGLSRQQLPVFSLISSVPEADRAQEDFYVTFTVSKGGALFVYAAVVDNRTGDGIYVKAIPAADGNETAPPAPESLTGTWKGGGQGFTMTWYLEQHGTSVTGYVRVEVLPGFNDFKASEFMTGALSGASLVLTATGLEGDVSFPSCVDIVTFTCTVDGNQIRGRYKEEGTCTPGDTGTFSVVRQ